MAPEQEARERAFYDHESDERSRRRRPAADWGVGEDIFDRMPSRRFKRAARRAGHQEIVIGRAGTGAEAVWVEEGPAGTEWVDERAEEAPRRFAAERDDQEPRAAARDDEVEVPRGRVVAAWEDE